eukprot:8613422-Lingulodinium_polyedra.AAC.1
MATDAGRHERQHASARHRAGPCRPRLWPHCGKLRPQAAPRGPPGRPPIPPRRARPCLGLCGDAR